MVTQQQFDDTLAKVGPLLGGLTTGVGALVTAVQAHPAAPDLTSELTQVQSSLDQLASLKTIIDAALPTPAAPAAPPVTPDPTA